MTQSKNRSISQSHLILELVEQKVVFMKLSSRELQTDELECANVIFRGLGQNILVPKHKEALEIANNAKVL